MASATSAQSLADAAWPLFQDFFGWQNAWVGGSPGGSAVQPDLELVLPEYHEVIRPQWVVANSQSAALAPLLLVMAIPLDDVDDWGEDDGRHWHVGPQAKLERLLRETHLAMGLLLGRKQIRLVYAPRGETSGALTFPLDALALPINRLILGAMRMVLQGRRLQYGPEAPDALAKVLADSRRFQAKVTSELADQVLEGLYELLRGFESANSRSKNKLLGGQITEDADAIYSALLTVMLRLIFLLYAEERGLLPQHLIFLRHYSLIGLHARLRADAALHQETMDHRFGAWAHLLVLFRMVFDGSKNAECGMPPRHGDLFNPDRFPFLEGRAPRELRVIGTQVQAPLVPDGTVFRVLEKLLYLEGERLSYRTLDVEQLGSVYETMMGFRIEQAQGHVIGIRAKNKKKGAADPMLELDALLAMSPKERLKAFETQTERTLSPRHKAAFEKAQDLQALVESLRDCLSTYTPRQQAPGSLVLQPTEERRRSGSHYTPRSLTEPMVQRALAPLLRALGPNPSPDALLALKVCDPAMGSGAFLVATCRHLAENLVEIWRRRHAMPTLPPDEDEFVYARRLVAKSMLYGVDRNPFAVELAKVSLWLATLARDHAFTFLDHALRCGDSVLGLSLEQIQKLNWDTDHEEHHLATAYIAPKIKNMLALRQAIAAAPENHPEGQLRLWLREADDELHDLKRIGDRLLAAYYSGDQVGLKRPVSLKAALGRAQNQIIAALENQNLWPNVKQEVEGFRDHVLSPRPFHWSLEFPEVFEVGGFDAVIGNPPFAGKNTITDGNPTYYLEWLSELHVGAHGNSDLVAHFFRRGFNLLKPQGTLSFIATNSAFQGDTRDTGLSYLAQHGFDIYWAQKRYKWPGAAAVVVCIIQGQKGEYFGPRLLDDKPVETITSFLFHAGGNAMPAMLPSNAGKSFQGCIILGMGFTFDDTNPNATPLAEMQRVIQKDSHNQELIFPYIGGDEVNTDPEHKHHRYVINFGERNLEEAKQWPDLLAIVEAKVKPERDLVKRDSNRERWWRYAEYRPGLNQAIRSLNRVLVCSRVSTYSSFTFLDARMVFSEQLVVFPFEDTATFAMLQSRIHEIWARFFASSMKDDLRYTPSDCFQTFPFPDAYLDNQSLLQAGEVYYHFRADLMRRKRIGLTETYNLFHHPETDDSDIHQLRALHAALDQAVLAAYGWADISLAYDFILYYADDEDESLEAVSK